MMDLVFIKGPIVSGIIWHVMALNGNGTLVSRSKEKHIQMMDVSIAIVCNCHTQAFQCWPIPILLLSKTCLFAGTKTQSSI